MKNPFLIPAIVIAAAAAAILIYSCTFIVTPREQALVVQFGDPVRVVREPGLHLKLPFIQEARFFEMRIMELKGASGEVITSDRKRIEIEAFARFRISDPLMFYRSLRDQDNATRQLEARLNSQLKNTIGGTIFSSILSHERVKLMGLIRSRMLEDAKGLGVQIVDVRIRRADLPQQNQEAVFSRMKTEREREAAEIRAKGQQDAQTIRAETDREVTVIKAEATRKSEILRGEGDAERNRILGEAYSKDESFFSFYRSLRAYEASFAGGNTSMVMAPDSPFFRYFGRNPGDGAR
jgi:membrane protease subunit HflC